MSNCWVIGAKLCYWLTHSYNNSPRSTHNSNSKPMGWVNRQAYKDSSINKGFSKVNNMDSLNTNKGSSPPRQESRASKRAYTHMKTT